MSLFATSWATSWAPVKSKSTRCNSSVNWDRHTWHHQAKHAPSCLCSQIWRTYLAEILAFEALNPWIQKIKNPRQQLKSVSSCLRSMHFRVLMYEWSTVCTVRALSSDVQFMRREKTLRLNFAWNVKALQCFGARRWIQTVYRNSIEKRISIPVWRSEIHRLLKGRDKNMCVDSTFTLVHELPSFSCFIQMDDMPGLSMQRLYCTSLRFRNTHTVAVLFGTYIWRRALKCNRRISRQFNDDRKRLHQPITQWLRFLLNIFQ